MQGVLSQIHTANMKAMLIARMNVILLSINAAAVIALIVVWSVEWAKEGGGFLSRYVACLMGLLLLIITTILSIFVHRAQPRLSLFYAHQVFAVLTLIITAISMGMNDVVVNLCHCKTELENTRCGAHIAELLADLVICLTMAVAYLTTQQRIVTFIDKGILDGIKGRSNGMTELP